MQILQNLNVSLPKLSDDSNDTESKFVFKTTVKIATNDLPNHVLIHDQISSDVALAVEEILEKK